jgi:hypothetical protein
MIFGHRVEAEGELLGAALADGAAGIRRLPPSR